jgi:hypothetical protein
VYTWSADKIFIQAIRQVSFTGETNFAAEVPLNETLKPGRYKLEGWLTTNPVRFRAETSFEVR